MNRFRRPMLLFLSNLCLVLTLLLPLASPVAVYALTESEISANEADLRAQLAQIESQIKDQTVILSQEQAKGVSIVRDIAILDAQITQAKLKIKAHALTIDRLGKDIQNRTVKIGELTDKINKGEESLSDIIRKTDEIETHSIQEIILSDQALSEFLLDLDSFRLVRESLAKFFGQVVEAKDQTEKERTQLDNNRREEVFRKVNVEEEKASIDKDEKEKKRLLGLSQDKQKTYQKNLTSAQQKAAQIRTALFALRDSAAIPFGTALEYANEASQKTGIRPAFLLAILTQETNLGANVGTCYMTDPVTGNGIRIKSGDAVTGVMKPSRDVQPFLDITKKVGRDPFKTKVSCPFSVGYGGAMGPAQFIPSTWVLFEDRIQQMLGTSIADPWNAEHAFMASAIYLSDLGASNQSASAEKNAACKYYSGKKCSGSNTFYGTQVMSKADNIQQNMIDPLKGY